MCSYVNYYVEKPNHNLYYQIGTDFCLENPSNTTIPLQVDCPLEREPLPAPTYEWIMILNETEVILEATNLQSLGVHPFHEDKRSIHLNATVALRNYTTINLECMVKNFYGNDTETTSISVCGM